MFDLVLNSRFEIFECNFESLKAELERLIKERYDIVVTEETVKDAKNVRADLNKGKKGLETAWKAKKTEMEAPIKELGEKAKALFAVCDEAIAKIDDQVAKFEARKRELAVELCAKYRDEVCEIKKIDPSSINVSGLSNLSYVTEKGALSSAGKQAVDNLVLAKIAELTEQRQRELEAEAERERIKQEAREELLREQAKQEVAKEAPKEEAKEEPKAPSYEIPKQMPEKVEVFASVKFAFKVKAEQCTPELAAKIEGFIKKELEKSEKLGSAFHSIESIKIEG